ncbi:DegV family protein [Clostridiaceae bacterium]|nr:DegV family protein [Clostridiaceae bacterium]NBH78963.1 DegV family protein [Clostridiaceae bacterium]NBI82501.1 DegV family protein [Clostridiaceae bacterium]
MSLNSEIVVISDTSCDYSADQAEAAGFSMVPLTVTFGDETLLDGLELTPSQFYKRLAKMNGLPKTSQPSPDAFMRVFEKFSAAKHIICVTVTGVSSGTVRSAQLAADLLREKGFQPEIHVVDSCNASAAVGLLAETACGMVRDGCGIDEILARLHEMQHTTALYFLLDTLEYVRKGGRIGNISAVFGQLLGIKPLLTFLEGAPTDVAKCRGYKQATAKLVQKFIDTAANLHEVIIVHADAPAAAAALAGDLKALVKDIKVRIHAAGAVIGTYAGPGAIGLAFEEKAVRW